LTREKEKLTGTTSRLRLTLYTPDIHCNAQMSTKLLKKHCSLDTASGRLLHQTIDNLGLSVRAYTRILKISRTIADLAGSGQITATHIGEAMQYRRIQYGAG